MKYRILALANLLFKISIMFIVMAGMVLLSGYMSKANGSGLVVKEGDKVKIHYTVSLKDGTVFKKSKKGKPLEFIVGSDQMPHGLDLAVRGMRINEEKKATVKPEDAYGKRNEDLLMKYFKSELPENFVPKKGMTIKIRGVPATIVSIDEEQIIVDGNHPLAGHDVIFDIKIVSIE